MNDKNTTNQDNERISNAWQKLQDAIQSAPIADLRAIIANDLELSFVKTKDELDRSIGQLVTLIRNNDPVALQVLHNGCLRMSQAVDAATAPEVVRAMSESGQMLDLQAVRFNFDEAIDDLIDLVRLGVPGALELLLGKGVGIANLLVKPKTNFASKTSLPPSCAAPSPASEAKSVEPSWRDRLNDAIQTLALEPHGKLAEAFSIVSLKLGKSRFSISKLSPSLPKFDPENPDIVMLYELCDQLVEKQLNPKSGRSVGVRDFLDGALQHKVDPAPESVSSELVVPQKPNISPTEFASQVYGAIQQMQGRLYSDAHLEEIQTERKKHNGGTILKELQEAKTKSLERGWAGSGEDWLNFRSPSMILDQLVALLPPLSMETITKWVDASVAYVFVWCNGDFEKREWPSSVDKAVKATGGIPGAIRKTLGKGFKSLVNANTKQVDVP